MFAVACCLICFTFLKCQQFAYFKALDCPLPECIVFLKHIEVDTVSSTSSHFPGFSVRHLCVTQVSQQPEGTGNDIPPSVFLPVSLVRIKCPTSTVYCRRHKEYQRHINMLVHILCNMYSKLVSLTIHRIVF